MDYLHIIILILGLYNSNALVYQQNFKHYAGAGTVYTRFGSMNPEGSTITVFIAADLEDTYDVKDLQKLLEEPMDCKNTINAVEQQVVDTTRGAVNYELIKMTQTYKDFVKETCIDEYELHEQSTKLKNMTIQRIMDIRDQSMDIIDPNRRQRYKLLNGPAELERNISYENARRIGQTMDNTRTRRGIFSTIGRGIGSIFDLTHNHDSKKMRRAVQLLQQRTDNRFNKVKMDINSLVGATYTNRLSIQNLVNTVSNMSVDFNDLILQSNLRTENSINVSTDLTFKSLRYVSKATKRRMVYGSVDQGILQHYENREQDRLTMLMALNEHKITPMVVPVEKLTSILNGVVISIRASNNDLYLASPNIYEFYNTEVRTYVTKSQHLMIAIDIPLSRKDRIYDLYSVISYPVLLPNHNTTMSQVIIDNNVLAVSRTGLSHYLTTSEELAKCEFNYDTSNYRCFRQFPLTSNVQHDSCEFSIFTGDIERTKSLCKQVILVRKDLKDQVVQIGERDFAVISKSDKINIECNHLPSTEKDLPYPTIVTIGCGCSIRLNAKTHYPKLSDGCVINKNFKIMELSYNKNSLVLAKVMDNRLKYKLNETTILAPIKIKNFPLKLNEIKSKNYLYKEKQLQLDFDKIIRDMVVNGNKELSFDENGQAIEIIDGLDKIHSSNIAKRFVFLAVIIHIIVGIAIGLYLWKKDKLGAVLLSITSKFKPTEGYEYDYNETPTTCTLDEVVESKIIPLINVHNIINITLIIVSTILFLIIVKIIYTWFIKKCKIIGKRIKNNPKLPLTDIYVGFHGNNETLLTYLCSIYALESNIVIEGNGKFVLDPDKICCSIKPSVYFKFNGKIVIVGDVMVRKELPDRISISIFDCKKLLRIQKDKEMYVTFHVVNDDNLSKALYMVKDAEQSKHNNSIYNRSQNSEIINEPIIISEIIHPLGESRTPKQQRRFKRKQQNSINETNETMVKNSVIDKDTVFTLYNECKKEISKQTEESE
jgi:hypothetical protein